MGDDIPQRRQRRDWESLIPLPLPHATDLVIVDTAWGRIQPMQLHREVPTIGEREVVEHLVAGLPLMDTRKHEDFAVSTIPGAVHLPHEELDEAVALVDPSVVTALFCNGPQCPVTPKVVRALLNAGHPPAMLRYYRGGMHDWLTLGYPAAQGHE
jgi:rhodanese-related sulfurtransferase